MPIASEFSGLRMDQLIGGPLSAAADASVQLANSTADFINKVGFQGNKVRTVSFAYHKRSDNEDGTSNLDEMQVDVPILAIVPIPNLQVDEVNILFDMEVKQSEKQESSSDESGSFSGSAKIGPVKISVSGSVSAHQSHTRSSDNSAKYHVDVRATNHGMPEGLARVLDMMAANIAPTTVGSTVKDSNGNDLSDASKKRAERLKALRQEISEIEGRLSAARKGLDDSIGQLKKLGASQQNVYQGLMTKASNALEGQEKADDQIAANSQIMDTVNQTWNSFQNQVAGLIEMAASSADGDDLKSFALKGVKATDTKLEGLEYNAQSGSYYDSLLQAKRAAVKHQKDVNDIDKELFNKKADYNNAMSGKVGAAPASDENKNTKGS